MPGHIQDRWWRTVDGERIQSAQFGVERRWQARYRGTDDRERSRVFTRKSDAERWLRAQTTALDQGDWVDPTRTRLSFGEFVPTWIAWAETVQRPSTLALNLSVLRNRLLPRFSSTPLGRISADEVRAMMRDIADQGLSTSSIRRAVLVLRSVLDLAVEHHRVASNVAATVRLPRDVAREMRTLNHDQVIALVRAHPRHFRPLVITAAYTGLRWGELAGLAPDRVDVRRQTIRIDRQLIDVNGKLQFGPTKTKSGTRAISIPDTVAKVLANHLKSDAVTKANLTFPTLTGLPMRRNNFRTTWLRAVDGTSRKPGVFHGTELANLVFHELRHTAASLAIAAGAHPLTIKERLGHSSITVTMDRYGHLFPAQDQALSQALDAELQSRLEQSDGGDTFLAICS